MEHQSAHPHRAYEENPDGSNSLVSVTQFDIEEVERRLGEYEEDEQADMRGLIARGSYVMIGFACTHEKPEMIWDMLNRAIGATSETLEEIGQRHGVSKQAVEKAWASLDAVLRVT